VHLARILGQATAYAAFGATIAWLSADPVWRHHDPAQAQIKLSFSHAGAKVGDCRRLTPELELDGSTVVSASLAPTGIAGDGPSSAYRRFAVAAGEHRIVARLRDSRRAEGFDYESATTVVLAPRQNFVVDFQSTLGGFRFR
jgi:hypothetical protein